MRNPQFNNADANLEMAGSNRRREARAWLSPQYLEQKIWNITKKCKKRLWRNPPLRQLSGRNPKKSKRNPKKNRRISDTDANFEIAERNSRREARAWLSPKYLDQRIWIIRKKSPKNHKDMQTTNYEENQHWGNYNPKHQKLKNKNLE